MVFGCEVSARAGSGAHAAVYSACCWKYTRRRLTAWGHPRAASSEKTRSGEPSGDQPAPSTAPGPERAGRLEVSASAALSSPFLPHSGLNPSGSVSKGTGGKSRRAQRGALKAFLAPGFGAVLPAPSPGLSSPARVSKPHHSSDWEMVLLRITLRSPTCPCPPCPPDSFAPTPEGIAALAVPTRAGPSGPRSAAFDPVPVLPLSRACGRPPAPPARPET